jgi:hypothetical protein
MIFLTQENCGMDVRDGEESHLPPKVLLLCNGGRQVVLSGVERRIGDKRDAAG